MFVFVLAKIRLANVDSGGLVVFYRYLAVYYSSLH